jgi:hypothetical protein
MTDPYAASQITGVIGVDDVVTGKHVRDVTPGLYEQIDENNFAPFVAVQASLANGKRAKNFKFEWTMKDIFPHWDVVATGAAAGAADTAVDVVCTNADYFAVNDVVEFPDSTVASAKINQGVITGKSTTTLAIHPIDSSYGLCATVAGERIHNMSNSSSEYSSMPGIKVVKDVQAWNYVQFFRVPYAAGIFEMGTEQYTGEELQEREDETYKEIKMQFERQCLWGERGAYTHATEGKKLMMRGVVRWITAADGENILDWSGGLTQSQFDEWFVNGPGRFGSPERDMFVSTQFNSQVHGWSDTQARIINEGMDELGLNFIRYKATNGKILNIIQHHMFEESYEGAALIVDNNYVDLRPFSKLGTFQHHEHIENNDIPGQANEWRIIAGVQVSRVEPNGWIHR